MIRSVFLLALVAQPVLAQPRVTVRFPATRSTTPLTGRLLLLFSVDPKDEPRNQISPGLNTQQVFGVDVDGWRPGTAQVVGREGVRLSDDARSPCLRDATASRR